MQEIEVKHIRGKFSFLMYRIQKHVFQMNMPAKPKAQNRLVIHKLQRVAARVLLSGCTCFHVGKGEKFQLSTAMEVHKQVHTILEGPQIFQTWCLGRQGLGELSWDGETSTPPPPCLYLRVTGCFWKRNFWKF